MLKSYLIKFNIYILNKKYYYCKAKQKGGLKIKIQNRVKMYYLSLLSILYKLTSLAHVMTYEKTKHYKGKTKILYFLYHRFDKQEN